MNRLIILSTTIVITLSSASTNAAVVERDWLTPGDGLLTYDTISGREWLDVPVSYLEQFAVGPPTFRDTTRLNNAADLALLELQPGGMFEGFTLANRQDVEALVASAGVDLTNSDTQLATGNQMFELLQLMDTDHPTLPTSPSNVRASFGGVGLINELNPFYLKAPTGAFKYFASIRKIVFLSEGGVSANLYFSGHDELNEPEFVGLMLYRTAVPEPGSMILLLISAFFGFILQHQF